METTIFSPNDKILFMDRYTDDYQSYELESSYLAGVIDGDGSLSCSSKYPFYIKLDICQCDFLLIFLIMLKIIQKQVIHQRILNSLKHRILQILIKII